MMLCLDIGNTQIYGGVFKHDKLLFQFRRTSQNSTSSDEIGVFLRSVLRENDVLPESIEHISVCTVVPEVLHSVRNACRKYFNITPFVLQAGVKTGLNLKYRNALELGADRIANAIAATHMYPNENLIVIDMGTATTICSISASKEFLGGSIIPGIKISMEALETNTAKLPTVEIFPMDKALGRSTIEGIQSGLYFSTMGAIKEITQRLEQESFYGEASKILCTGGFTSLFKDTDLYDEDIPDLILKGLYLAYKMNATKGANHAYQPAQI